MFAVEGVFGQLFVGGWILVTIIDACRLYDCLPVCFRANRSGICVIIFVFIVGWHINNVVRIFGLSVSSKWGSHPKDDPRHIPAIMAIGFTLRVFSHSPADRIWSGIMGMMAWNYSVCWTGVLAAFGNCRILNIALIGDCVLATCNMLMLDNPFITRPVAAPEPSENDDVQVDHAEQFIENNHNHEQELLRTQM